MMNVLSRRREVARRETAALPGGNVVTEIFA